MKRISMIEKERKLVLLPEGWQGVKRGDNAALSANGPPSRNTFGD